MNKKRLQIYFEDHTALIVGELELIRRCRNSNQGSELGDFLENLQCEVENQRKTIDRILELLEIEASFASSMKQGAAWFAEKIGRFKLNDSLIEYSPLSRIIELEGLAAAALERVAMWEVIACIANDDRRLDAIEVDSFQRVSEQHLSDLRTHRQAANVEAFQCK